MTRAVRRARRVLLLLLLLLLKVSAGIFSTPQAPLRSESAYPLLYRQEVMAASLAYEVPEELIYAVIAAESSFDPTAESVDGARGLMQMIEPTFRELTGPQYLNENRSFDDLFLPEVSIRYGAYYLRYLYDLFDGDWTCAVAAYNGGLGNVRKWLKDPACVDVMGKLTYIPFAETRAYVAKVERTRAMYRILYFTPQEGETT